MNLVLIILCVVSIVTLCVLVTRRNPDSGRYRRRFENRYRHDTTSDSASPILWMPTLGIGDAGSHHHAPDSGAHCSHGSDGGGAGCGDGGSS